MKLDYIIVGQGLAGTVLSHQLLKRNKKVMVINDSTTQSSSDVAAGIFNPVTGRKMVKSWNANKLFPFLQKYYASLEKELSSNFYYPKKIYRPFVSIEEQNEWMGKSASAEFGSFISQPNDKSTYGDYIHDPFGGLTLDQCGYVDIPELLMSFRQTLINNNSYLELNFDEEKLEIDKSGVKYGNLTATKLIFCDGPAGINNKFFNWLPFRPVKGEILFIKTEKDFEVIFNRGVFILPLGAGICKVGATYEWKDLSLTPSAAGRKTLVEKLDELIKCTYVITGQKAGIRPATKDRRPLIGLHPEYEPLGIFNGLGTKGVSLAPYFADQFLHFIETGRQLDKEVNINRYFSLYYH